MAIHNVDFYNPDLLLSRQLGSRIFFLTGRITNDKNDLAIDLKDAVLFT